MYFVMRIIGFFHLNKGNITSGLEIVARLPHLCCMTRKRPQIVSLSERAAARVKELLHEKEQGFLRVGVKNGGCAGMEYTMDYVDEAATLDEMVEDKGVRILVDAAAVLFLLGATIDYEQSILHSKFTFKNPNETDACGCGISVTIEPVEAA